MKKRKPGRPLGTLKYPFDKIKLGGWKVFNPEKEISFRSAAYRYARTRGLSFQIKALPDGLRVYNLR
ncbi:hypothetical protein LZG74_25390 [Dyadobacter sp. CY327]|uniref:hypothetical protein n=1 Tax=Dyadobacter sp. CY327 TaxID=2907301 RepID=UPI001F270269|nr:hypothetical protein [Dyadobacter sp. CY327]MCE7073669.1 hypothetical protein [Dyadobacter sp. CY327]